MEGGVINTGYVLNREGYEELIGKRFGRLKVESYLKTAKNNKTAARWYVKCVCDCGNTTLVLRTDLLKGKHVSCGRCGKWEVCEYLNNKCYKCTVLSGSFFIIDFDQYEKVSNKQWYDNGSGYFYTCLGNKRISLHRFLTNCPSGMVVDHVNHLKYDNTMKNLRVCTQAENMRNKSPEYISEFVGIRKRKNRYSARIALHSKEIHVGTYDTIEEAIAARKKKLDELLISEERICA